MTNKTFKRTSAAVLGLTLASLSLMAGTMAKYTSTYSGSDTLTVAKWGFKVNDKTNVDQADFTLDLVPTNYSNVDKNPNDSVDHDSLLAPGTGGQFSIVVENLSDVAATYTVTFTTENKPTNLHFYYVETDENNFTTNEKIANDTPYTVNVTKTANSGVTNTGALTSNDGTHTTETVVVYWYWAYNSGTDATDTGEGVSAKTMKVNATVVATQAVPTE